MLRQTRACPEWPEGINTLVWHVRAFSSGRWYPWCIRTVVICHLVILGSWVKVYHSIYFWHQCSVPHYINRITRNNSLQRVWQFIKTRMSVLMDGIMYKHTTLTARHQNLDWAAVGRGSLYRQHGSVAWTTEAAVRGGPPELPIEGILTHII